MRRVRRIVLDVLCPALCLSVAAAARAGQIRGRLLSEGKPAAGVTVSAAPYETPHDAARREAKGGEEAKPIASTTSGADGSFALAVAADPLRSFVVRVLGGGVRAVELPGVYDSSETEDSEEHTLAPGDTL
ncbi:MAG: hypothetical protein ACM3JH_01510, partial [Acidithiobacillales bacterium]